jgi:hypothetical protein
VISAEFKIQVERLRRHYALAIHTYDPITLLDLSNVLRIWVELRSEMMKYYDAGGNQKLFKSASPTRRLLSSIRKQRYILSYLADGVRTYASNGQVVSGPTSDQNKSFSAGATIVRHEDSSFTFKSFSFIGKSLSQKEVQAIGKSKISKCDYSDWLGSEILRINDYDKTGMLVRKIIPRSILIKRVANILDGSHSSLASQDSSENQFDEFIIKAMSYTVGGLPLPYYLIIKIAGDLVNVLPLLVEETTT